MSMFRKMMGSGIPRDLLWAEWLFNGNALDTSGNSRNGTVANATLTNDRKSLANSAYSFSGASGNGITILEQFPTAGVATYNIWVNKVGAGNGYFNRPFGILSTESSTQNWAIYNGASYTYTSITIPLNTWAMITMIIDYTAKTVTSYKNGILASTLTVSNPSGIFITIGGVSTTSGNFNGILDDFRIYTRALTTEEITKLYNE